MTGRNLLKTDRKKNEKICHMKKIGNLLNKRKLAKPTSLDPETVFYVFRQIIKEEYGKQGEKNIKPVFYRDKKIFTKIAESTWQSELEQQKKYIISGINDQLGSKEVSDLEILG